jgi:ABC-2 type transport system ATP-binding protein
MAAIETFALEKWYRSGFWRRAQKCALRPLTLAVEEGEIFGCLGPNGAGKTTTLKLLMGLVAPTAGSARILGLAVDDPRMKTQIGFLPEQPYFYDYLTAAELLKYYAQLSGVPAREQSRRVEAVLTRVGLAEVGRWQLRKFSKGMLQRIGIAQAIVHEPKVVFLDEPMSGLDPVGRREVRDLIQSLKDQGKTVFFSTHILSDAEALCDRVAVLHRGELRGIGVVSELAARMSGKMEILWEGAAAATAVRTLGAEVHVTGETARAVLPETVLTAVIDELRRSAVRLISVTPVRITLEDYFLEQLGETAGSPGSGSGTTPPGDANAGRGEDPHLRDPEVAPPPSAVGR